MFQDVGTGPLSWFCGNNVRWLPYPPVVALVITIPWRGRLGTGNREHIRRLSLRFLSYMLVLQWLVSPVVVCQLISKWWWAGSAVWLLSTSYWTLLLDGRIGPCFLQVFADTLEDGMLRCVLLLLGPKPESLTKLGNSCGRYWSSQIWQSCTETPDIETRTLGDLKHRESWQDQPLKMLGDFIYLDIIRSLKYSWARAVLDFKTLADLNLSSKRSA